MYKAIYNIYLLHHSTSASKNEWTKQSVSFQSAERTDRQKDNRIDHHQRRRLDQAHNKLVALPLSALQAPKPL